MTVLVFQFILFENKNYPGNDKTEVLTQITHQADYVSVPHLLHKKFQKKVFIIFTNGGFMCQIFLLFKICLRSQISAPVLTRLVYNTFVHILKLQGSSFFSDSMGLYLFKTYAHT